MSSRAFVFLGLLLAFVLLLSSEVTARDLAETSSKKDNKVTVETNGVEDAKYGEGYNRGYGGGPRGYGGGGYGGGSYGGGGYGGGCQYGRCGYRCCSYAGEVVEGAKP